MVASQPASCRAVQASPRRSRSSTAARSAPSSAVGGLIAAGRPGRPARLPQPPQRPAHRVLAHAHLLGDLRRGPASVGQLHALQPDAGAGRQPVLVQPCAQLGPLGGSEAADERRSGHGMSLSRSAPNRQHLQSLHPLFRHPLSRWPELLLVTLDAGDLGQCNRLADRWSLQPQRPARPHLHAMRPQHVRQHPPARPAAPAATADPGEPRSVRGNRPGASGIGRMHHSGALGGRCAMPTPANLRPSPRRAPRWHTSLVVVVLLAAAACSGTADTPSTPRSTQPATHAHRHRRRCHRARLRPRPVRRGHPGSRCREHGRGRWGPLGAGRRWHGGSARPANQRGGRQAAPRPRRRRGHRRRPGDPVGHQRRPRGPRRHARTR